MDGRLSAVAGSGRKRGFRWAWLWLFLLIPAGVGLARLRLDVEILNLLPERLGVSRGLKIHQRAFSDAKELVVTVEGKDPEVVEAAAKGLAELLRQDTQQVERVNWQPAWQENPRQAAELIGYLWLNQPPEAFRSFSDRLMPEHLPQVLEETRRKLATSLSPTDIGLGSYDPFGFTRLPSLVSGAAPAGMGQSGEGLFRSVEGNFRLIYVDARPALQDYRSCIVWVGAMRAHVARARATGVIPPEVTVQMTGRPAFVTEISGGMESDMAGSAGGTLATIGILFWLTHRRLRPMFWLLFLLLVILIGTTALGGLVLGTINVVSIGFASILLGLAEDFGIVIYQESRSHPHLGVAELRREVAPGILWSAVTTAGAFLVLNLSVLPGLGQLGTLVAIGIILGALVMLYGYLPPLLRMRRTSGVDPFGGRSSERFLLFNPSRVASSRKIWVLSVVLFAGAGGLLFVGGMRFDRSPNVLRPKDSEAYAALERIRFELGRKQDPMWLLIPGKDEGQVAARLDRVEAFLHKAEADGVIAGVTFPTALWPRPANQAANREAARKLVEARGQFQAAAGKAGFQTNAMVLADAVLDTWARAERLAVAGPGRVFWPEQGVNRWMFDKFAARSGEGVMALGMVTPTGRSADAALLMERVEREWGSDGVLLTGWELLGATIFRTVMKELPTVMLPILVIVVGSLWMAFRNVKEVLLSLGTLVFSAVLLGGSMRLLGWDWNLLNLMALPLLLGMGVDFSIHIQLALRREGGDRLKVGTSVGRALLLAGTTTVAGFGSLAWSTNAGMASLGKVCALGIALALGVAVFLLPVWWESWLGKGRDPAGGHSDRGSAGRRSADA